MTSTLFGYSLSVYTRVARLALVSKGVRFDHHEVNPFTDPPSRNPHPFNRVPLLRHNGADIFETRAITRYVDCAFDGPALGPSDPLAMARMEQAISVIDTYGYRPMVRQVFVETVMAPALGLPGDQDAIVDGLEKAAKTLAVLESFATEGLVLTPNAPSLADFHLAPMLDYFTMPAGGQDCLAACPALSDWWDATRDTPHMQSTRPDLRAALSKGSL
jgi:glutathione S-transferase